MNKTHSSQAHRSGLHSRHSRRRRTVEECSDHFHIYTHLQSRVRVWESHLSKHSHKILIDSIEFGELKRYKQVHITVHIVSIINASLYDVKICSLTMLRPLIGSITAVIYRIAELVTVDAAGVITAETEWRIT